VGFLGLLYVFCMMTDVGYYLENIMALMVIIDWWWQLECIKLQARRFKFL
jgi:hypothetical protein